MPKYYIHSGPVFWDTDHQVANIVMKTAQLPASTAWFIGSLELLYNMLKRT